MSSSVLRSRETSRVFWALLLSDERTPLDISLMLRISQSAVVKHLDKLRAVRLVKRGKKVASISHTRLIGIGPASSYCAKPLSSDQCWRAARLRS